MDSCAWHHGSWSALTQGPVGGGASRPLLRIQDVHTSKEGRVFLLEPMPAREVRLQFGPRRCGEHLHARQVISGNQRACKSGASAGVRLPPITPY